MERGSDDPSLPSAEDEGIEMLTKDSDATDSEERRVLCPYLGGPSLGLSVSTKSSLTFPHLGSALPSVLSGGLPVMKKKRTTLRVVAYPYL